jgi:hypothetical protein
VVVLVVVVAQDTQHLVLEVPLQAVKVIQVVLLFLTHHLHITVQVAVGQELLVQMQQQEFQELAVLE